MNYEFYDSKLINFKNYWIANLRVAPKRERDIFPILAEKMDREILGMHGC